MASDNDRAAVPAEPFLTYQAAADVLDLPLFKIRRAAKAGLFPTYSLLNKRKLVRLSEIVTAIERSSKESAQ
jgi:hypothetical protein